MVRVRLDRLLAAGLFFGLVCIHPEHKAFPCLVATGFIIGIANTVNDDNVEMGASDEKREDDEKAGGSETAKEAENQQA